MNRIFAINGQLHLVIGWSHGFARSKMKNITLKTVQKMNWIRLTGRLWRLPPACCHLRPGMDRTLDWCLLARWFLHHHRRIVRFRSGHSVETRKQFHYSAINNTLNRTAFERKTNNYQSSDGSMLTACCSFGCSVTCCEWCEEDRWRRTRGMNCSSGPAGSEWSRGPMWTYL